MDGEAARRAPAEASGALRRLSPELRSRMRSATIVTCLGQVVEELACNSVDAGATKVSISVDTGATLSVAASDDGRGMRVADVKVVGARYHTSKLHSARDLERGVSTLGFRGEALASIADSCALEVTSRAEGSFETYTMVSAGGVASSAPARYHLPRSGTVVTCRDLFHAHPVRRGVVRRNVATQLEDARQRVYRLALIHPEIGFTLVEGRRTLLRLPPGRTILRALSDAFGSAVASSLRPVDVAAGDFRLRGYITPAGVVLRSPELAFFFVNRRFVRRTPLHREITAAFAAARRSISVGAAAETPPGGHPGFALNLECPPRAYDVTYDAEKTLIEFSDWRAPLELLRAALREAWPRVADDSNVSPRRARRPPPTTPPPTTDVAPSRLASDPTPEVGARRNVPPSPPSPPRDFSLGDGSECFPPRRAATEPEPDGCLCCPPWPFPGARSRSRSRTSVPAPPPPSADDVVCVPVAAPPRDGRTLARQLLATWRNPVFEMPRDASTREVRRWSAAPEAAKTRDVVDGARAVAQWGNKFILAANPEGDVIAVDQHAADERVRLEALRDAVFGTTTKTMTTMTPGRPTSRRLTPSEMATLRARAESARRWGWRWETDEGENAFLDANVVVLTCLPAIEGTTLGAEALAEYLRELAATGDASAAPPALHRLLASKACRGAIMFGDALTEKECDALLRALRRTRAPTRCAHGRPTTATLARRVAAAAGDERDETPRRRRRTLARRAMAAWRAKRARADAEGEDGTERV